MNRYTYVGGDPVNRVDPRGTDWITVNGGWCSTLDPNGGCYDPGYGDPDSGGGGNPCPSFDPNVILALEQSSLGPTLAAQAAAMGCTGYSAPVIQTAAPQLPVCTLTLDIRGSDYLGGFNVLGFAHGYLSMTESNLPSYTTIYEGQNNGNLIGYAGRLGLGSYASDDPATQGVESVSGTQVCGWDSVLRSDVNQLNDLNIRYNAFGPNSNTFLRYMLMSLPGFAGTLFTIPFPGLIGYNAGIPGLMSPKPFFPPRGPRPTPADY